MKKKHLIPLLIYLISIISCYSVYNAFAAEEIWIKTIIGKSGKKPNIGIVNFVPVKPNSKEAELGREITDITRYDILFSRYFNVLKPEITPEMINNEQIYFEKLASQGIDVLLSGTIKIVDENTCVLVTKLYDTSSSSNIFVKTYTDKEQNYRYIAHKLSDEIVRFTGHKGIANTKITFINDSTGHKEIYIVDYDGYNPARITRDNSINLFPRWSPDGKKIIYTTYKHTNPDMYCMSPDGTNKKPVSTRQGLNVCGSWASDSGSIVLTLSMGKSPGIYHLNLAGEILHKITSGNNVNTSPWFSPNNRQIVFISDKAGYPQMYLADIEGTNFKRLYTEGYSDSPVWSPDGDIILFSMRIPQANFFDIYAYDLIREKYYQLTANSGTNESPSISPDGRYVVFSSARNNRTKSELFIMCIDGSAQRKLLDIDGSCNMPNWSP